MRRDGRVNPGRGTRRRLDRPPRRRRAATAGGAALLILLAACGAKTPTTATYLGAQPVDLQELTPAEVAREVEIVPRGNQVFFQAPTIQVSKLIDLHRAGKELGITLGKVERVRFGYLLGVLDRSTGTLRTAVLFQSNFITGNNRYVSVTLADGTPLQFSISRAPDPCVPNCYPVMEALIIQLPDAALRAAAAGSGLGLIITLDNGEVIRPQAVPAYVRGYLQAVDGYRAGAAGGGEGS